MTEQEEEWRDRMNRKCPELHPGELQERIEKLPRLGRCQRCGWAGQLRPGPFKCPNCGAKSKDY